MPIFYQRQQELNVSIKINNTIDRIQVVFSKKSFGRRIPNICVLLGVKILELLGF